MAIVSQMMGVAIHVYAPEQGALAASGASPPLATSMATVPAQQLTYSTRTGSTTTHW
eukprot:CAMPEP_0174712688 /NCGR_PEP_ID=MMETSP1094-20130205/13610_1 /TAXON_ID=156173 /ORGANISM="Chrysochromulina brevifilum, Strain UTEX LB 985" /LENGTH=56 /DNA_ID=CAMNT_0015911785 /DNA_START=1 /DNA_END=169 /DNA_ORIENTATION=+